MSTTSKHFGLSYREESYMFRELEKVRRKAKQDFLQFKQKLAFKTTVDRVPVRGPARSTAKGGFPGARPREPPGSLSWAKGPAVPEEAGPLQQALPGAGPWGPGEGAAPWRPQPFRPRDFYLRSSAFRRHPARKEPPVIATGAGTSRPVVLRPPPAFRRKPGERAGRWSPQPKLPLSPARPRGPGPAPAPAPDRAPALEQGSKVQAAAPAEAWGSRATKSRSASRASREGGEAEPVAPRRRVRIRSQALRDSVHATPRDMPRSSSKASADSIQASDRLRAGAHTPLPARVIPRSIEDIIASLQSEAQLASDQTIKELIQSVLGQNYDIDMEVGAQEGEG